MVNGRYKSQLDAIGASPVVSRVNPFAKCIDEQCETTFFFAPFTRRIYSIMVMDLNMLQIIAMHFPF